MEAIGIDEMDTIMDCDTSAMLLYSLSLPLFRFLSFSLFIPVALLTVNHCSSTVLFDKSHTKKWGTLEEKKE